MFRLIQCKWNVLKELVKVLKIPYQATLALQLKNLMLSDTYETWNKTIRYLSAPNLNHFRINLSIRLIETITNRKDRIFKNPAMKCALYLHPKYNKIVLTDDEVEDAKDTIDNLWERVKILFPDVVSNLSTESFELDFSTNMFENDEIEHNRCQNNTRRNGNI